MEDVESDSDSEPEPEPEPEGNVESNPPNNSQIPFIEQPHSAPPQLPSPSRSPIQEATSESEYIIIPEAKRVPSDNSIDV